jgi:hypothetical protein
VLFHDAQAMIVEIAIPVRPLVLWDPMRIGDDFTADSSGDYTVDTGAGTFTIGGAALTPTSTAVKRLHHTSRGYLYEDVQATLYFRPGASGAVNDAVTLKRLGASSSLYVQITQAALGAGVATVNIGKYTGSMTTIDGGATAVTLAASTDYWLRGRVEGNLVTVELWTAQPTPMGTPAASRAFTLTGGDATTYGQFATGAPGMILTPATTGWRYWSFTAEPYVYRNQTLPQKLQVAAVPGSAPALADVTLTASGGSAAPAFALIGWTPAPGGTGTGAAVGVNDSNDAVNLLGWASSAQAGARNGSDLRVTTAGAGTYSAQWLPVTPYLAGADDFSGNTLELEIWARALVTSTLVNPRLIASIGPQGTTSGRRYTHEFGATGRLLTKPSASTVYRFTRLGVISTDATSLDFAAALYLDGTVDTGSTGAFGFDYVIAVPARRRALSPTGVPLDTGYPKFAETTVERVKKIRSDLSATTNIPSFGTGTYRDHGLGGNLIQPGVTPTLTRLELVVKLSSLVPDDPTSDTTTEQLAHSATVQVDVTPRSYMMRGA